MASVVVAHGMWNLPGSGIKLVSPALAGGFLTTGPPGKSSNPPFFFFFLIFIYLATAGLSCTM